MTAAAPKSQTVIRFVYSDAVVRALGGTYRWSVNGDPLPPAKHATSNHANHPTSSPDKDRNAKAKKVTSNTAADYDILVECEIANLPRIYSELLEYNAELSGMSRQRSTSPNKSGRVKKDGKGGQGKVAGGKSGKDGNLAKGGKKNGNHAKRKSVSDNHVNFG